MIRKGVGQSLEDQIGDWQYDLEELSEGDKPDLETKQQTTRLAAAKDVARQVCNAHILSLTGRYASIT